MLITFLINSWYTRLPYFLQPKNSSRLPEGGINYTRREGEKDVVGALLLLLIQHSRATRAVLINRVGVPNWARDYAKFPGCSSVSASLNAPVISGYYRARRDTLHAREKKKKERGKYFGGV